MGTITAAWINERIAKYNSVLGTSLANATTGQRITSSFFSNIIETVGAQAKNVGYDVNLPSLQAVAVGQEITLLAFGDPVALQAAAPPEQAVQPQTTRWSTAGTYTFVVAGTGVTQVQLNWIVGPGGGGGYGSQVQNGGGGGGGGSGGYLQNVTISVNPGDVLTVVIGKGGQGGTVGAGSPGGTTTVAINGNIIYSATGGQGGAGANTSKSAASAPGGVGGALNGTTTGLTGQTGPGGASDTSSSYGGAGAPSPVQGGFGGAGGGVGGGAASAGSSAGSNGVAFGAGGGGGGCKDRTSPGAWYGGNGADGFVEFTYPPQSGSGTPAQNNSSYNVNALANTSVVGGGYTGSTGVPGTNYNGSGVRSA